MSCLRIGLLVYLSIPHYVERALVIGSLLCHLIYIDEVCGKGWQMLLLWFL